MKDKRTRKEKLKSYKPTMAELPIPTTKVHKTKKKKTGQKVTGGKIARAIAPKRLGTRSLQIPLLVNSTNAGTLNYS